MVRTLRLNARRSSSAFGRTAGLLLLVACMVVRVWDPPALEYLRLRTFDFYQRWSPRVEETSPVMIVDIDEDSLSALGQWPWPRTLIGRLLDRIAANGAVAVGIDVLFPEPDRMSPAVLVDNLPGIDDALRQKLIALPSNDEVLARSFLRMRVVVGQSGYYREVPQPQGADAQHQTGFGLLGPDPSPYLVTFPGLLHNVPEIERAAAGRGLFSIQSDQDGIVRRIPAIMKAQGAMVPALTVELLRVATGSDSIILKSDASGVRSFVVGGVDVPTDSNAQLWLHFNKHDPARYISARDVIEGSKQAKRLAGKLVLIGSSAVGLLDLKATPVDAAMPGVEVHAQMLENILNKSRLVRPANAIGIELFAALVTGLIMITLLPRMGVIPVLFVGIALSAVLGAGSLTLFRRYGLLIDVVYPLISSILVFWTLVFVNYLREQLGRNQIRSAFGQYLSPAFVEELVRNPEKLKLGGETKEMSILFSDIRGFTSISESLKGNPQDLTRLINRLLTPLSNVVVKHKGTIDKYMGDNLMAFWNAPLDDPEHAIHACESAFAILQELETLNIARAAEAAAAGLECKPLAVGVGINSGECVVGNMGSDLRFDYTVLGDSVNLASRLEGQTKTYGVPIIIGSRTAELVGGRFAALDLDLIKVKGKSEPERIFTLIGDREVRASRDFAELKLAHDRMLANYRRQAWTEAMLDLEDCRTFAGPFLLQALYLTYADRIRAFRNAPPPSDWDGVHEALGK